jgi:hypothetical protein
VGGDDPVRGAHLAAGLLLGAASDALQGLNPILQAQASDAHFPMAQVSTGRTAVEACARAAWLLEAGIDARERVARGMTERLVSLWELERFPASFPLRAKKANETAEITSTGRGLKFTVKDPTDRKPGWIGFARPSATHLVADLLAGADRWGAFVYQLASAATHLTEYALVQLLVAEAGRSALEGEVQVQIRTPLQLNLLAAAGLLGFILATDLQVKLNGWPAQKWFAWRVRALVELTATPEAEE